MLLLLFQSLDWYEGGNERSQVVRYSVILRKVIRKDSSRRQGHSTWRRLK